MRFLHSCWHYSLCGIKNDLAECQRISGLSRKAFNFVFYSTYFGLGLGVIASVWLFRQDLPTVSIPMKLFVSFGIAAFIFLVAKPILDISISRIISKQQ